MLSELMQIILSGRLAFYSESFTLVLRVSNGLSHTIYGAVRSAA